jgi:hypothetical protein
MKTTTSNHCGEMHMSPIKPTFFAGAVALLMAACGSSAAPSPSSTAPGITAPTPSAATPTPSAATPTTAATVDLSGTWSGQYSGVYNGTFSLTWQQSGSTLSGTIILSSPARTLGITGNVAGSAISFGAVGAVTYTGTVSSGNTMSGSYKTPAGGTGSWSATKAS